MLLRVALLTLSDTRVKTSLKTLAEAHTVQLLEAELEPPAPPEEM
jgi:hypothetical protein